MVNIFQHHGEMVRNRCFGPNMFFRGVTPTPDALCFGRVSVLSICIMSLIPGPGSSRLLFPIMVLRTSITHVRKICVVVPPTGSKQEVLRLAFSLEHDCASNLLLAEWLAYLLYALSQKPKTWCVRNISFLPIETV